MHGFGTPVKRPPDSITPRFRRPIRNNIHPSKNTSPITKKEGPRDNAFQHRLPAFNAFLRTPRAFPLPCLSLTNRENREQGFYKVKNLGRGRGRFGGGRGPLLETGSPPPSHFPPPPPPPISHNNLLPERHAHVAVDEHVRLHVLADGLRRGGGKLREDFVGIAL